MVDPNLVWASRTARRQAEKLLPGCTLEVEITRAIYAGRKRHREPGMPELCADQRYVLLADGILAVIEKRRSRVTERLAWHVVQVLRVEKDVAAGFRKPQRAVRPRVRDTARGGP